MNQLEFDNSGVADSVSQLTPDEQIRMRDALRDCSVLDSRMGDVMAGPCDNEQTSSPAVIRACLQDIRNVANISDRQLWEPVRDSISYDRFYEALYYNDKALTQKEWHIVEAEYANYVHAFWEGANNASQHTR